MRTTKLTAVLVLALGAVAAAQEAPQQEAAPDAGKREIEVPTETVIRLDAEPADLSRSLAKDSIEVPTKGLIAGTGAAGRDAAKAAEANPKVAPGLVSWHADLAAAKAAAAQSGRPVLLLQILGDLDREFC